MPWKECSVMDERLQFVARRLAGEAMSELCREFGISRKTGYKIFDRYQECGLQGLTDRSRRPYRYANQLPFQVENFILNVKREHPSWGARKIRERLLRRFSGIPIPVKSTIHAVLDRHGFVERHVPQPVPIGEKDKQDRNSLSCARENEIPRRNAPRDRSSSTEKLVNHNDPLPPLFFVSVHSK